MCIVLIGWIAEIRLHFRNAQALESKGAIPFGGTYYCCFYFFVAISLVVPLSESLLFKPFLPLPFLVDSFVICIMVLSNIIRWITIDSINQIWTLTGFRHPNLRRWKVGLYNFLNHPEYVTRIIDSGCYWILFGGGQYGLIVFFVLLIAALKLMSIEDSLATLRYDEITLE